MSKPRINSRAKGAKHERDAARTLEEWTDIKFVKTPASGGLRWASGFHVIGDIVPEDMYQLADFPFSVEVKARRELDFEDLLLPNKSELLKFWKQASDDAKRAKKFPLLLARRDRMPKGSFYVFIPLRVFRKALKYYRPNKYIKYGNQFIIVYSEDFFSNLDYDDLLDAILDLKP